MTPVIGQRGQNSRVQQRSAYGSRPAFGMSRQQPGHRLYAGNPVLIPQRFQQKIPDTAIARDTARRQRHEQIELAPPARLEYRPFVLQQLPALDTGKGSVLDMVDDRALGASAVLAML